CGRDRHARESDGPGRDVWEGSPPPARAAATEAPTAARESSAAASTTTAEAAASAHETAPRRPHRHVRARRPQRVVQAALTALETHRLPGKDHGQDAEEDEEADHRKVRSPTAMRAGARLAFAGPLV